MVNHKSTNHIYSVCIIYTALQSWSEIEGVGFHSSREGRDILGCSSKLSVIGKEILYE